MSKGRGGNQTIRIIGGEWRGRKLHFPAVSGLRPTLDRLRETLFNWLMFEVEGKRCLDVFAGSGALGLEALSRRARSVTLIEKHPRAMESIKQFLHEVQDTRAKAIEADALRVLTRPPAEPFDIVFLDPPFHKGLLGRTIALLEKNHWLADDAWIYVECEPTHTLEHFPAHWDIYREISTSGKKLFLMKRHAPAGNAATDTAATDAPLPEANANEADPAINTPEGALPHE